MAPLDRSLRTDLENAVKKVVDPVVDATAKLRKERLFANPTRPNAMSAGGKEQLLESESALADGTSIKSYFTGVYGLNRDDVVLKSLVPGRRVIAVVEPHRYTRVQSLFGEFSACFKDADHVIVAPLYIPLVVRLGFNPIWFGILYTITCQIAYITPPFGYNLFLMRALAPTAVRDLWTDPGVMRRGAPADLVESAGAGGGELDGVVVEDLAERLLREVPEVLLEVLVGGDPEDQREVDEQQQQRVLRLEMLTHALLQGRAY